MCNRFHQSAKAAQYAFEFHGLAVDVDVTLPPPKLFPTGKKTARYGAVVRRSDEGNRPLILQGMEWGLPTRVPGKKPGVMLEKFVTNCRNVESPFWRSMLKTPAQRCLVPFTDFAEPRTAPGEKGDDGLPPQWWFKLADQDVGAFAGIWRQTERGPAFAFLTCEPNGLVAPLHPKAMPLILDRGDYARWLEGSLDEVCALIRPFPADRMQVQTATPQVAGAAEVVG